MTTASKSLPERRFLFDAHATTLRGKLTRPNPVAFDSSRTLSLPLAGGEDKASDDGIEFDKVLSIGKSSSYLSGHHDKATDTYETTTVVTVENLSILEGRLKAKLIEARLTESYSNRDGDRTFSVEGSRIDGLEIEGEEVQLDFDDLPFRKTNLGKVLARKNEAKLRGRLEQMDAAIQQRKEAGSAMCSLTDPRPLKNGKAAVHPGACIVIPNFGRIWLAELLMTPDTWRLTMLRAKLGSPAEGEFEVADTGANGQRYPP